MEIKKKLYWVILLITFSIFSYYAKKYFTYNENKFSCSGRINFFDEVRTYSVQVRYSFNGGEGEVVTLGEYSEIEGVKLKISQQLSFNYTQNGNDIVMVSTGSTLNDNQARLLDTLVPDFYLYKDRGFRIRIYKQDDSSYVFTTYGAPIFICYRL